ncbi:hypothetical protein A1O3_04844 [Capronia epimyces CBS 606.96]|uniref:Uncharacterized protein n=1 Tax=Capronia epimyces CBS 606.96 TaxID=1182542 RepID=W9XUC4_9EURO|nr:uncharacterized protein A1O3_04844 [Capronia epimyces CBS 606.96]EXJ84177.1 hypothetical protein A1O3_04844 [Capronia epimyces CBS 606.96]
MSPPSTNPALTAYKVYHLSQIKLDNECRRQTPDLHRIVGHASIVDNVRRWSRETAELSETVLVDSDSDTDSDPFEDPASDEDSEHADTIGQVAIYDDDLDDNDQFQQCETDSNVHNNQTPVDRKVEPPKKSTIPSPQRRPPPPPPATSLYEYEIKTQNWKQNRPILVKETIIEVDADD